MVTSIDSLDVTHSKLHFVLFGALKRFSELELFECVQDENVILRTLAAREVHMRGTVECFDFALNLTKSSRFEDREIGAYILGQLGTPELRFLMNSLVPLEELLTDAYYEVRGAAVGAFGFLAAGSENNLVTIHESLFKLANDQSAYVREALALTLGSIRTQESRTLLNHLLDDEEINVKNAAAFGIELHDERAATA